MKLVLYGSEYVPADLLRESDSFRYEKARFVYDDIPLSLRATAEDIKACNGARDKGWVERRTTTLGCRAARPLGFPKWVRCHLAPEANGFCKRHKGWEANATSG